MTIDLFIPCFIDQVYPETGFNVIKILEKAGCEVKYNVEQTCCGQMAFNSGFWSEARKIAEKFVMDFPYDRPIVSPSASCSGYIKNHYPELFKDSKSMYDPAKVTANIFEFTDFLVNKLNIINFNSKFKAKVTYHDACAALREYGIREEPRKLINNIEGVELIEMKDTDTCCGFGGTFSVKHKAISSAMAEQKVQNALETGAEYIVSTELSCLLNLQGYIDKNNLPIKTIHIADLIAKGL
jgi:L-lactate dehydrogenase complex protein LldE